MSDREQESRTACAEVAELLPVYLNRSLEEAAARRVENHLAACSVCRQEERDTRTAQALFSGHLPAELLVDYALAQSMPSRSVAVVESHLAACERCSGELALIRRDTTADEPASGATADERALGATAESAFAVPQTAGRESLGSLRALAWAACLAAVVAAAGWIQTWRQMVDERALSAGQTARANLTVVELLPATGSPLRRGSTDPRSAANQVELPADAGELVLVLLSGGRSCESGCILEIFEAGEGQPKRRVEGLSASPDGHLTLALPGAWLPPERSVLAVRDQASGELVVEYLVETAPPATGR